MATVFTLGYEGADIAAFLGVLHRHRIDAVIDVRAAPFSRKADFAKRRFSEHLSGADIAYLHLAGLGNPKAGREAAQAGDVATYQRIFQSQLESAPAQADLARLARRARAGRACLVCLEAEAGGCHRSLIAERLARDFSFRIEHLRLDGQASLPL